MLTALMALLAVLSVVTAVPETVRDHTNAHGNGDMEVDPDMPGMMSVGEMAELKAAEVRTINGLPTLVHTATDDAPNNQRACASGRCPVSPSSDMFR